MLMPAPEHVLFLLALCMGVMGGRVLVPISCSEVPHKSCLTVRPLSVSMTSDFTDFTDFTIRVLA